MQSLVIRDRDGNVIQRSRNLAGIRRYVGGRYAPLIKTLAIDPIGDKGWEGQLSILFADGSSFQTNFSSLEVLKDFVKAWRNVWGSPLVISGKPCGEVSNRNPYL